MKLQGKNKKYFAILIKISVFVFIFCLLFNQITKIDLSELKSFSIKNRFSFILVFLLIFVNWFLEFLKWKVTLQFAGIRVHEKIRVQSFLAGIVTGFLTPNLIGNFLGRMFYFPRNERPGIILLTLFSNAAQFLASIFFGIVALILIGFPAVDMGVHPFYFILLCSLTLLFFFFLFFQFEHIPWSFIQNNRWVKRILPLIKKSNSFRIKLLFLSFFRHFVFSMQYFLLLKAFGLQVEWEWLFGIWEVFFFATLVPSLWMGKLLIRESIALWILSNATGNGFLVLLASVVLWCLNQLLPALVGIPFLTRKNS